MYATVLKYNESSIGKKDNKLFNTNTTVTIDLDGSNNGEKNFVFKLANEDYKYIVRPYLVQPLQILTNISTHSIRRCISEDDYLLTLEDKIELMIFAINIEAYNLSVRICKKAVHEFITQKNYHLYERFLSKLNKEIVYNYIVKEGL